MRPIHCFAPARVLSIAAALASPALLWAPAAVADPAPADLVGGLLDRSPDARAAAAVRIGAAELTAAAPTVPVLVEALDDDAPAVAKAAHDAIVALATRAAPVLASAMAAAPLKDGESDVAQLLKMLGAAMTPSDLANALARTDEKGRSVAWLAVALVPLREEWTGKSALRLAVI